MVHPGTLFYRRQRGTPMHSFEHRSQIRALLGSVGSAQFLQRVPMPGGGHTMHLECSVDNPAI
jgi:hypothetical protein